MSKLHLTRRILVCAICKRPIASVCVSCAIGVSLAAAVEYHAIPSVERQAESAVPCFSVPPVEDASTWTAAARAHTEAQLAACEAVLDLCVSDGVLDEAGIECYKRMRKSPTVAGYAELVAECFAEDLFGDTVQETDAWMDYTELVLPFYPIA